jgi:hypothetical protein
LTCCRKLTNAIGPTRRFVTSEFKRFVQFRDMLFPGAVFSVDGSSRRAATQKGGTQAIAAFLMTQDCDSFTSVELAEATGTLPNHLRRILSSSIVVEAMKKGGWSYVPGRGRSPSRFVHKPQAIAAE